MLHASAKSLVEKEKLTGDEFRKIFENPKEILDAENPKQSVSLEKADSVADTESAVSLEKDIEKE